MIVLGQVLIAGAIVALGHLVAILMGPSCGRCHRRIEKCACDDPDDELYNSARYADWITKFPLR